MTIEITQFEINHFICGYLTGMLESATCGLAEPFATGNYQLVEKWELKEDGTWKGLNIHSDQIFKAYRCYAGCGSAPEESVIPSFISNNWPRAEKLYRILKGI